MLMLVMAITPNADERLTTLFKQNANKFYSIAYSVLHNSADAEDAVAETFIKLCKLEDKVNPINEEQMTAYATTVLKNVARDIYTKRKRERSIDDVDAFINLQDESINIESEVLSNLAIDDIKMSILMLDDIDQAVINARFMEDMAFKNIAKMFNLSEDAAKKRCRRALKKLSNLLDKENLQ